MKANVITKHGGAKEVFSIVDMEIPVPGKYDLLIKVEATSVNPLDCKIRKQSDNSRQFPIVLGFDVCGIIEQKGELVENFKLGDRIYASPHTFKPGANAEYVLVDARTCSIAPNVHPTISASIPLACLTAYEALFERIRIQKDDTILIHAGAGGVGHFAVQLGHSVGAKVIATASREESISFCKNVLNAEHIINHKEEPLKTAVDTFTGGKGLKYILDTVGGDTFENSLACLQPNGHICTILPVGISPQVGQKNLIKNITISYEFMGVPTVFGIHPEKQGKQLAHIAEMVNNKTIIPKIQQVFPFEEINLAHELMDKNQTIGKIVIEM